MGHGVWGRYGVGMGYVGKYGLSGTVEKLVGWEWEMSECSLL